MPYQQASLIETETVKGKSSAELLSSFRALQHSAVKDSLLTLLTQVCQVVPMEVRPQGENERVHMTLAIYLGCVIVPSILGLVTPHKIYL